MTTTPNKGYTLQTTGSNNGTWGVQLNNIFSIIDLNLGGLLVKSVAGSSNVTLSSTEAENIYQRMTGILTGNIQYVLPNLGGFYIIENATTGAFTVKVVSTVSGTGITVAQGTTVAVFVDAANTAVIAGQTAFGTALAIAAGGTGATDAADARTNLGLGALAVLSAVTTATINSGAATNGQILAADGAGGTSWVSTAPAVIVPGLMFDYGGITAPTGYLNCDGTAVSRATYADLFAAIGATWGTGDGTTTFNLPDFRRRTAVGSGGTGTSTLGNTVGNFGGEETHTLVPSEAPSLNHSIIGTTIGGTTTAPPTTAITNSAARGINAGSNSAGGSSNTNGLGTPYINTNAGDGAHNNIQPSAIVLKIIKT